MGKAVFLDRDGVINEDVDHLNDVPGLRLLPGVARAIKVLNEKEYHVIVVTNQAAIAKGMVTPEVVDDIHEEMKKQLSKEGAVVDGIYYCPHHPDGTVKEYAVDCHCRKPDIGMIEQAMKDFTIDPKHSFLVGDKTSDILAGQRAGLKTILVKTGYAGKDGCHEVSPDAVVDDLAAAAAYIS